jgi:uncharacterized protein (TIGR00251 family)
VSDSTPFYRRTPEGIVVNVLVQPRAGRNQLAGLHDGAIKLRLTAAPVEGAANKACLAFLAKALGTARSRLEIVAGQTSRRKQVLVRSGPDLDPEELEKIIRRSLVVS